MPPQLNSHRCICCWENVVPANENRPRVCDTCFALLSPAERAARVEAMNQVKLLGDIRGHLNVLARNNDNDENQLGSIAKAFENFGRMLKLPAGKANELFNQIGALVRLLHDQAEKAAERDDEEGGESWR